MDPPLRTLETTRVFFSAEGCTDVCLEYVEVKGVEVPRGRAGFRPSFVGPRGLGNGFHFPFAPARVSAGTAVGHGSGG
jgi:hypothetical protein